MTENPRDPTRKRLHNRRQYELIYSPFRGCHYILTLSRFPTGDVAEIFVCPGRPGSDAAADANDAAIVISLSVQHGMPLEALRRSISRIEGNEAASTAGAVPDILAAERERGGK
jgi:hypothetical protein